MSSQFSPSPRLAYITIVVLFVLLSLAQAVTRIPFCDEAWLASAPRNLLTKGYMGTSYVETAGTNALRIDRFTYWVPPLYPAAMTVWDKLVGFGMVRTRMASLAWGLLAIACWMAIVFRLIGHRGAAILTGFLIASDYFFVGSSATGRMDMMSAALGALGCATYLYQRQDNLTRAILLSQFCAAAALFTHPNAIGEVLCLCLFTVALDGRRLRLIYLPLAVAPYFATAAGWGIYIAKDPTAWRSQLLANSLAGREERRFLVHLSNELFRRYAGSYGFGPRSSMAAHAAILIPICYATAVLALLCWPALRRRKGSVLLASAALISAAALTLFELKKSPLYLVHGVPAYDAAFAVFLAFCWSQAAATRFVAVLAATTFVTLQLGANLRVIHANSFQTLYTPAIQFLRNHSEPNTSIMGNAELAFGLGFPENLHDDYRLGFFNGIRPQIIVVDKDYRTYFESYRINQPSLYAYVTKQLSRCRPEFRSEAFTIYTGCGQ